MAAGCCGQLIVVVGSRLGSLVEGVEGLGVRVSEVIHGGGRGRGRPLVLVVVSRREGWREVRRLEIRVLVRTRHGVGRCRVSRRVPVMVMVMVGRAERRGPTAATRPNRRNRPMARQPILKHQAKSKKE